MQNLGPPLVLLTQKLHCNKTPGRNECIFLFTSSGFRNEIPKDGWLTQ